MLIVSGYFVSATLLNLLLLVGFFGRVFMIFCGYYDVICKEWRFNFFFTNIGISHFFFLFDYCVNISSTMLNKSGKSGHPCLVPDLKRKTLNFSRVWCWLWCLLCWGVFPPTPIVESFYHEWMLNLISYFSASVKMIIWFLSFVLLMWCMMFIDCEYWTILASWKYIPPDHGEWSF